MKQKPTKIQIVKRKERLKNKSVWDFKPTPDVEEKLSLNDNIKRKPHILILGIGISLFFVLIAIGTFWSIKNVNEVPTYMTSVVIYQPEQPSPTVERRFVCSLQNSTSLNSQVVCIIEQYVQSPWIIVITLPFVFVTWNSIRKIFM